MAPTLVLPRLIRHFPSNKKIIRESEDLVHLLLFISSRLYILSVRQVQTNAKKNRVCLEYQDKTYLEYQIRKCPINRVKFWNFVKNVGLTMATLFDNTDDLTFFSPVP